MSNDGNLDGTRRGARVVVNTTAIVPAAKTRLIELWEQSKTNDVIPPVLGFFLLHIGVAWVWQEFWVLSFRQNGFLLSQLLLFFGLYLMSLKTVTVGTGSRPQQKGNRAVSTLGFLLVAFAVAVMFNNTKSVVRVMRPNNIPARATASAQPAPPVVVKVIKAPPAPAWSVKYTDTGNFSLDVSGCCILIQTSNAPPVSFCSGEKLSLGETTYLRFQSKCLEPAIATISR